MSARLLLGISVLWIPLALLFDGVTVLVLPLRLSSSATNLGLVSFIGLTVAAAVQPVVGWSSDRWRRRIDRRGFVALAALPAVAGMWLLAGTSGVVAAVLGYVLLQGAASAIQAGEQTLIPEHVPGTARGAASGLKTAFDVGGAFVAFLLLGAVLSTGGLVPAAAVTTLILVAAVIVMLVLVPSESPVQPRSDRLRSRLPAGFVALVSARFLFLLGTYTVGRFLLLLVADRLMVAPESATAETGGVLAILSLATAAASFPFGWLSDRLPRHQLMYVGAVVSAVGVAVLIPAAGIGGLLAGGFLMSIGTAAFVTANWAATATLVPAAEAGRLMGIANLGTAVAAAAAGLVGPLIDAARFGPALVVAAVACATSIVPLGIASPRAATTMKTLT